ncbi:DUF3885 domain-containing protein [Pedobacter hiemivivus]|uniref:DUF3885 domain-containing protein n=1 Tax=Pedobacter hiemivivus TaxID=2530454 RepID=A0A4R0NIK3_9SPHI|nr:DUF3885 domain-containing protein [Pedobacter hiemivivus]TCC99192.1 DUF3885 domain-containing protein [Pedobacter hiemivivus]
MHPLKKEVSDFMSAHFNNSKIRSPLFFNSRYGLRFDLQCGEIGTDEYFHTAVLGAQQLFEEAFSEKDSVMLYLVDFKWKRRKLRFSNYCFKQIERLTEDEIEYHIVRGLYESENNLDIRNVALIKVLRNSINHIGVFTAIANKDFSRQPGLDKYGFLGSKEVYFINLDKQIIFHMYDDRGLDIIASNIEVLKSVYFKFNHLLLEVNRNEIDKNFSH